METTFMKIKYLLSMMLLTIALAVFISGSLVILLVLSDYPEFIFACIGVYASMTFLLDKI